MRIVPAERDGGSLWRACAEGREGRPERPVLLLDPLDQLRRFLELANEVEVRAKIVVLAANSLRKRAASSLDL